MRLHSRSVVVAIVLAGATVHAQSVERSLGIGVAQPTGGLGANRGAGPLLQGAVTLGDRWRRHVRLRLEVEGAWMRGDGAATAGSSWSGGTLRSVGAFAVMVVGDRGAPETVAPHLLLGLGLQRMAIPGVANPYGNVLGARVGGGVQWRAGSRTMFAELAAHAAATDFGTTSDFSVATYLPLTVGIRF